MEAVEWGDAQSLTYFKQGDVPFAFTGEAEYSGGGTNIILGNNIVLNVELRPWRYVKPAGAFSEVEVMGKLKDVDFKKRIIYIIANPQNYIQDLTL